MTPTTHLSCCLTTSYQRATYLSFTNLSSSGPSTQVKSLEVPTVLGMSNASCCTEGRQDRSKSLKGLHGCPGHVTAVCSSIPWLSPPGPSGVVAVPRPVGGGIFLIAWNRASIGQAWRAMIENTTTDLPLENHPGSLHQVLVSLHTPTQLERVDITPNLPTSVPTHNRIGTLSSIYLHTKLRCCNTQQSITTAEGTS